MYGRARSSGGPSLYFAAVNAEFNWWLLIVGLVVGAGLVWFVLMDTRRRDVDVDETERPREALWLSRMLADEGHEVSPEAAERLLLLHRSYLEAPPPDDPRPSRSRRRRTSKVRRTSPQSSPLRIGSASSDRAPDIGQ